MKDYLLEHPWLYEHLFDGNAADCLSFFERHLEQMPETILDIGCGSGRDIHVLSQNARRCVGVDYLPELVDYAKAHYPGVTFHTGDMLDLRLGETFDVVLALGASINYALTNAQLDQVMETYKVHCKPGSLLLLQPVNSHHFIGELNYPDSLEVSFEGKTALARITYELDKSKQLLTRYRQWTFTPGGQTYRDSFQLRLIFPMELTYILANHGFDVVEASEVGVGKKGGSSLYVAALYRG